MSMMEHHLKRASRVVEVADALAAVEDGMTVAIGGFINSGHPMVLVRGLIRERRRNLRIVGAASAGLETDMLIAAGCVREVVTPYVGAEGLAGIAPAFRKAAQDGDLSVFELDEAHFYAGLRASAQRLPFNPWRAGVGTDYPRVNPALKEFRDPINNELMLAIPAIEVDVAFLHAATSDEFGNVQHLGTGYGDVALYAASAKTYVSVERIVPTEQVRANPERTSIPGATGIIRATYGAHPFSADGAYVPDVEHIKEYLAAATSWLKTGDRSALETYLATYVHERATHAEYLDRIGFDRLLTLNEF